MYLTTALAERKHLCEMMPQNQIDPNEIEAGAVSSIPEYVNGA